ncbi:MAG: hypothetical protein JO350_04820 [Candidatus Eremiobacteraeota bacterium]|nr:hypothetical protein [Candidatus Eremiobacteraeota bacterium]
MALGIAESLVFPLVALFGAGSLGAMIVVAAPHRHDCKVEILDRREPGVCSSPLFESDALTVLRRHHDRASIALVRSALWSALGAGRNDTLEDVLARPGASELGDVLVALERGAFTSDGDLHDALHAACSALERFGQ